MLETSKSSADAVGFWPGSKPTVSTFYRQFLAYKTLTEEAIRNGILADVIIKQ